MVGKDPATCLILKIKSSLSYCFYSLIKVHLRSSQKLLHFGTNIKSLHIDTICIRHINNGTPKPVLTETLLDLQRKRRDSIIQCQSQ